MYLDDMIIMSKHIDDINDIKCMMSSMFDMKDLEVADLILGIRILKNSQGLALYQSHYIKRVLDKLKYLTFNVFKTPIELSFSFKRMKVKVTLNWNMSDCWKV